MADADSRPSGSLSTSPVSTASPGKIGAIVVGVFVFCIVLLHRRNKSPVANRSTATIAALCKGSRNESIRNDCYKVSVQPINLPFHEAVGPGPGSYLR